MKTILDHVDDKKGSRARKLGLTLMRRVGQHAHAEPKYLGSLISDGYNESILLMKMVNWHFLFSSKVYFKMLLFFEIL